MEKKGFSNCCFEFFHSCIVLFVCVSLCPHPLIKNKLLKLKSSFILFFEFCVQILVPPSGLKDGSNNIRPLRNQFQMLNVTISSWKFGVGRKGGYRGTPIKKGTLFFSWIYTLSEFCGTLGLPIGVAPQYKMGSCWLCCSRMWHFQQ